MKAYVKEKLKSLLNYPPVPCMSVDNLYGYLDVLYHNRLIDGPVVEIGCAIGGTTALSCRFLSRIGCRKDYYCIDTFSGFVKEHLDTDHQLGLPRDHDKHFKKNSVNHFKKNLARWGLGNHIHVVKGDICKIADSIIPQNISVALLDVDLRDPIYYGLKKLHGKLSKGGIILVDDCKKDTSWVGANVGYLDYVKDHNLQPKYYLGFGVVESLQGRVSAIPWQFSESPNPILHDFYS